MIIGGKRRLVSYRIIEQRNYLYKTLQQLYDLKNETYLELILRNALSGDDKAELRYSGGYLLFNQDAFWLAGLLYLRA